MEQSEFRVLIKHYFLIVKNTVQTKQWLDKCYGESSPSRNKNDAERSGSPKYLTSPEIVKEIHDIVLDDPKVKVRELTEATGIPIGSVVEILHEDLGMKKLTAK